MLQVGSIKIIKYLFIIMEYSYGIILLMPGRKQNALSFYH